MTKVLAILILVAFGLGACGGPGYQQYKAGDAIAAFQKAGLSADGAKPVTRAANDQSPNVAKEDTEFTITSIAPKGGHVMTFSEAKDLDAMKAWYARFPDLAPYVYTKGNVLVQLNSGLAKGDAEKYKAALGNLK